MNNIFAEIELEIQRQNEKWGVQDHSPIEWMSILSEEIGETAKEALDHHFNYPAPKNWKGTNAALQENRLKNYRKELIQVVAVATQMILSVDRNELKSP